MTILVRSRKRNRNYIMSTVEQIAKGFFNNLTNRKEELYNERINICRSCKLLAVDNIFGPICNSRLYVNPETNEVSKVDKPGFTNGCGCVLNSKCRVPEAKCPLGRW